METISKRDVIVKCDTKTIASELPTFKAEKFHAGRNELTVEVHESPHKKCWRLVHDETKVLHLFESGGITGTAYELFCGTEKECQDEIKRLGLKPIVNEL